MELLWLVGEEADGDTALQLWLNGKRLSPFGRTRIPRSPLRGLAQMAETLQAVQCRGREISAAFSLKCSLHERYLCRNGCQALFVIVFFFFFFKFEPVSHRKPFLVGIFFLRVKCELNANWVIEEIAVYESVDTATVSEILEVHLEDLSDGELTDTMRKGSQKGWRCPRGSWHWHYLHTKWNFLDISQYWRCKE